MSEIAEEIRVTLENIRGEHWSADDVNGIIWSNEGQRIFSYTVNEDDAEIHLIANAPTWLRTMLEEDTGNKQLLSMQKDVIQQLQQENERLTKENSHHEERMKHYEGLALENAVIIDQLREALAEASLTEKLLRSDLKMLRAELDHISASRDRWQSKFYKANDSRDKIASELDQVKKERDEHINELQYAHRFAKRDMGYDHEYIESILSQYKGDTTNADKAEIAEATKV